MMEGCGLRRCVRFADYHDFLLPLLIDGLARYLPKGSDDIRMNNIRVGDHTFVTSLHRI